MSKLLPVTLLPFTDALQCISVATHKAVLLLLSNEDFNSDHRWEICERKEKKGRRQTHKIRAKYRKWKKVEGAVGHLSEHKYPCQRSLCWGTNYVESAHLCSAEERNKAKAGLYTVRSCLFFSGIFIQCALYRLRTTGIWPDNKWQNSCLLCEKWKMSERGNVKNYVN